MHDARDLRKASYGYLRFPGVGCAAQKGGETQQNRAARQAVDCSAGCVHLTRLKSALKPAAYTSSQTVTLTAVQHHLHLHPHHPWVRAHTCTSTCSTHSPAVRRLQQQRRSHPPLSSLSLTAVLTHYQRDGPVIPVNLQSTGDHLLPVAPAASLRSR